MREVRIDSFGSSGQYSGCRADANEAAVILLPSNITVFTLDFSGSGLSDGDYVSLGWHEVCYSLSILGLFDFWYLKLICFYCMSEG